MGLTDDKFAGDDRPVMGIGQQASQRARGIASARLVTCSSAKMLLTWVLTVLTAIDAARAISALDRSPTIRRSTSGARSTVRSLARRTGYPEPVRARERCRSGCQRRRTRTGRPVPATSVIRCETSRRTGDYSRDCHRASLANTACVEGGVAMLRHPTRATPGGDAPPLSGTGIARESRRPWPCGHDAGIPGTLAPPDYGEGRDSHPGPR